MSNEWIDAWNAIYQGAKRPSMYATTAEAFVAQHGLVELEMGLGSGQISWMEDHPGWVCVYTEAPERRRLLGIAYDFK